MQLVKILEKIMFGSSAHCNVEIIDTGTFIQIVIEGKLVAVYSYCDLSAKLKFAGELEADPNRPFEDLGITINTPNGPLVIDDVSTCLLDPVSATSEIALVNLAFLTASCSGSGAADVVLPEVIEAIVPLVGVAPIGAKWGVDTLTGHGYYVNAGQWVEALPVIESLERALAPQTVVGQTPVDLINFNTPDLPHGIYEILISYSWSHDAQGNDIIIDLLVDGVKPYTADHLQSEEPKDATIIKFETSIVYYEIDGIIIMPGIKNVVVELSNENVGASSTVSDLTILVERIQP